MYYPSIVPAATPYYVVPPKSSSSSSSKISSKVLRAIFALCAAATIVLAGAYLGVLNGNFTDAIIRELRNPQGLYNALPPYLFGGIALLSCLLVTAAVGAALSSRGFVIFAVTVALGGVSYFAPVWEETGLIVMGVFVQLFCLFTALTGWRLSEAVQDESSAKGVNTTKGLKVPMLMIVGIVWTVIYMIGAIFLLISEYAQAAETAQILIDRNRVAITGSMQLVSGLLAILSFLRKFRTGLVLSACLGLFVVVQYGALLPFASGTHEYVTQYCNRSESFRVCPDADWVYVHMVMRWLNWAFAIIFFWLCFYSEERVQSWEEAEIRGVDRNLSDPFSLGCIKIHRPILFYRRVLAVLFTLWTAFIAVILAVSCIAEQNVPGLPLPSARQAGLPSTAWVWGIIPMIFSAVGAFLGFIGLATNRRTALTGSIVIQLGFFFNYIILLCMSARAAIDGVTSTDPTTLVQSVTLYTGFPLAIAFALAVCGGICLGILCMSAPISWLLLEALQDAKSMGNTHLPAPGYPAALAQPQGAVIYPKSGLLPPQAYPYPY